MKLFKTSSLPLLGRLRKLTHQAVRTLVQKYLMNLVNDLTDHQSLITNQMATFLGASVDKLTFDHFHFKTTSNRAFKAALDILDQSGYERLVNQEHFVVFKTAASGLTIAIDAPTGLSYPWQAGISLDHLGFILKDAPLYESWLTRANVVESKHFGGQLIRKGTFDNRGLRQLTPRLRVLTNLNRFELMDKSPGDLIKAQRR